MQQLPLLAVTGPGSNGPSLGVKLEEVLLLKSRADHNWREYTDGGALTVQMNMHTAMREMKDKQPR
jgi:hypothetical protein